MAPREYDLEYWRARLSAAFAHWGSLQHPEVLRISQILDEYVVQAQHEQGEPMCPSALVAG